MKILFIHNLYQQRGGEEKAFFSEIELLRQKGHKTVIFCRDSREISRFRALRKFLLFFNTIFSFAAYRELREAILKEKPDVAHIHNIFPLLSPAVYFALKKYRVPVVQTLHNYRLLCVNALFLRNNGKICELCKKGNFSYAFIYRCYRKSYMSSLAMALSLYLHRKSGTFKNKVDLYLAPSRFLKQKMETGGIPKERTILIPHFISLPDLSSGFEIGSYAVYMGRLSPEKGLFTLLEAWRSIKGVGLKIIGDGKIKNELQGFALDHGITNVEFLGRIDDEKRFGILEKALFLVFPSECYENMPYAILESLGYGVAVVASRIGGLQELIEEGVTGSLFEPGNVKDLREKIIKLSNEREFLLRMRQNARKTAQKYYSQDKGYENIINAYQSAIKNNE